MTTWIDREESDGVIFIEEEKEAQVEPKTLLSRKGCPPYTDAGNAERMVKNHGDTLRYVHGLGRWLRWEGTHWSFDDTDYVTNLAIETARQVRDEARGCRDVNRRDRIRKYARISESLGRIRAMIKLASANPAIAITADQLDRDTWLLNVENGTVDLRDGSLRAHDPEDLITHCLPFRYDPQATCPTWERFLYRVFDGDEELIEFVQRAVGYSLTAETSEQALFSLHGLGANGKSTFLEVLRELMGDLAKNAEFATLLSTRNKGIRNDLARLRGARVVTAAEAGVEQRFDEGLVKQLTGEDVITARHLYHEYFEFRPRFKLWLAANHRPEIRETGYAMWRRIRLIPFNVTIPKAEQDPHLRRKLRSEMVGILAWAVEGSRKWREDRSWRAEGNYRRD